MKVLIGPSRDDDNNDILYNCVNCYSDACPWYCWVCYRNTYHCSLPTVPGDNWY